MKNCPEFKIEVQIVHPKSIKMDTCVSLQIFHKPCFRKTVDVCNQIKNVEENDLKLTKTHLPNDSKTCSTFRKHVKFLFRGIDMKQVSNYSVIPLWSAKYNYAQETSE